MYFDYPPMSGGAQVPFFALPQADTDNKHEV